jgi:hypothetical protein
MAPLIGFDFGTAGLYLNHGICMMLTRRGAAPRVHETGLAALVASCPT